MAKAKNNSGSTPKKSSKAPLKEVTKSNKAKSAKPSFTKKQGASNKPAPRSSPKKTQLPISNTPVERFEDKNLEPISSGDKNKPIHLPKEDDGRTHH